MVTPAPTLSTSFPSAAPRFAQCERGESNPHTLRYRILSPARLPVPPLSQVTERYRSSF